MFDHWPIIDSARHIWHKYFAEDANSKSSSPWVFAETSASRSPSVLDEKEHGSGEVARCRGAEHLHVRIFCVLCHAQSRGKVGDTKQLIISRFETGLTSVVRKQSSIPLSEPSGNIARDTTNIAHVIRSMICLKRGFFP